MVLMIYFENSSIPNAYKYTSMYLTPAALIKIFILLSVLDMG